MYPPSGPFVSDFISKISSSLQMICSFKTSTVSQITILCCAIPFIILSYVFAITNQDAACQADSDDSLMKLWAWVLTSAILDVFSVGLFIICYPTPENIKHRGALVALMINMIFIGALFIAGGITIDDNQDCITKATPLGVWTLIIWSLHGLYEVIMCYQWVSRFREMIPKPEYETFP